MNVLFIGGDIWYLAIIGSKAISFNKEYETLQYLSLILYLARPFITDLEICDLVCI